MEKFIVCDWVVLLILESSGTLGSVGCLRPGCERCGNHRGSWNLMELQALDGPQNGIWPVRGNRGRPIIAVIQLGLVVMGQCHLGLFETNVVRPDWPFHHPDQFFPEDTCCICMDRLPIVYGPCGHISMCIRCSRLYRSNNCPICRGRILQLKSLPFILNMENAD
jgi:hypothetical protein